MTPMPNRSKEVDALCRAHPEAFPPGEQNDPARLSFLKGTIIPSLNALDGGRWGYMTKTDQGGKVPCDILMWRDTNDVVDCMTGTGGSWIVHAPPPPEWVWTAVGGTPVPPEPEPPPSHIPYDEAKSVQFGQACNAVYAESGASPDGGMIAVHAMRCAYDYYCNGMLWDACYTKHVNEFRKEYGLPPIKS